VTGRLLRAVVMIGALALAGATLFGVWHVVVGGLVAGNPRAATFGVQLALGAGTLLAILLLVARGTMRRR
jgi:hypothetical protein